jgi:hypothetical protein
MSARDLLPETIRSPIANGEIALMAIEVSPIANSEIALLQGGRWAISEP